MIFSHSRRFIFVKTRKTAGTSVEIALASLLEDEDVATAVDDEGELIRSSLGYPGPQNELIPLRYYGGRQIASALKHRRLDRYYNHMSLQHIRESMRKRDFDRYLKFTIERNPWDRAVSLYWYRTRRMESRPPMFDFLREVKPISNWDLYTIDGEVAVDFICRYENLESDLADVLSTVGVSEKIELPRAKGSFRMDRRVAADVLGRAERETIARRCHREIAEFGYVCPGAELGHDGG